MKLGDPPYKRLGPIQMRLMNNVLPAGLQSYVLPDTTSDQVTKSFRGCGYNGNTGDIGHDHSTMLELLVCGQHDTT